MANRSRLRRKRFVYTISEQPADIATKPTRLYLVGLDGRVVYAGGLGPFGFSPEELKSAIDIYLATEAGN